MFHRTPRVTREHDPARLEKGSQKIVNRQIGGPAWPGGNWPENGGLTSGVPLPFVASFFHLEFPSPTLELPPSTNRPSTSGYRFVPEDDNRISISPGVRAVTPTCAASAGQIHSAEKKPRPAPSPTAGEIETRRGFLAFAPLTLFHPSSCPKNRRANGGRGKRVSGPSKTGTGSGAPGRAANRGRLRTGARPQGNSTTGGWEHGGLLESVCLAGGM